MKKCNTECEWCWCKVYYAKSGIVTAYCAKTEKLIRNVAKHICNVRRSLFDNLET